MMYYVKQEKYPKNKKSKMKLLTDINIEGFMMPSRSNKFKINGENITNIKITNKDLAHPLAIKKVKKLYKKLIMILTELLITDDDSGETYKEALNQIEKFRQEIKNKYRKYLEKKELETMSKQLKLFQLEAKNKFVELQMQYNEINSIGKSR